MLVSQSDLEKGRFSLGNVIKNPNSNTTHVSVSLFFSPQVIYTVTVSRNPLSILLVVVQLAALGVIFFSGPVFPQALFPKTIFITGIFLGIWAFWEMRKSKLQATPDVAQGSRLIKSGPYQLIRHPMYTGLLLITISVLISYFSPLRLIAAVILTVDLLIKIQYEEKLLNKYFKEYGRYSEHTWRLVPFIY